MFSKQLKYIGESRRIWRLLRPQRGIMALSVVFMGIGAMTTAFYAYLVGPVLRSLFSSDVTPDVVLPGESGMSFVDLERVGDTISRLSPLVIGLMVVGVAAIKGVAFFAQQSLVIRAGQRVLLDLRSRLYRGLLCTPPLSRQIRNSGDLISRFTIDAQMVEQAVTGGAMSVIGNGLQAMALIALALNLSASLAFVGLLALGPVAFTISRIGAVLRKRQVTYVDAYAAMATSLEESCRALPVLSSFDARDMARHRFQRYNEGIFRSAVSAFTASIVSTPINEVLGAGALGMTLWYAQARIADGQLTPSAFISFFSALFLLYRPVKGLGRACHVVVSGLAALDNVEPMLTRVREPACRQHENDDVCLRNVTAGYQENEPVIHDVSMTLKKGEKVALVGESGGGKTTVLNVLAGYLPVMSGTVMAPWPVSVVLQEVFLFDDTVEMNVRVGNPDADDDAVYQAMHDAGVTSFIEELQGGVKFVVGINGATLSVGQRQRICLARALLADRPLYLLDEVTAGLDTVTEQTILERLRRRLADKTVILVTHRVAAARWADNLVEIENGRVKFTGTFADFAARPLDGSRLFEM